MSDEWFNEICWSSFLFGIFMIKQLVDFSLSSFRTLKYNCVIKTKEMFNFLFVTSNSVTVEFNFLLLIISSKTINTLSFLPRLHSLIFL